MLCHESPRRVYEMCVCSSRKWQDPKPAKVLGRTERALGSSTIPVTLKGKKVLKAKTCAQRGYPAKENLPIDLQNLGKAVPKGGTCPHINIYPSDRVTLSAIVHIRWQVSPTG